MHNQVQLIEFDERIDLSVVQGVKVGLENSEDLMVWRIKRKEG